MDGEENIGVRSSRRLRKRVATSQLSNEIEDGVDSIVEHPTGYVVCEYEDANVDGEYRCENESGKKNVQRKKKKSSANENPDKNSIKESKAPKRFPHSTRRKKRCGNFF